jgi:hypothetical protein
LIIKGCCLLSSFPCLFWRLRLFSWGCCYCKRNGVSWLQTWCGCFVVLRLVQSVSIITIVVFASVLAVTSGKTITSFRGFLFDLLGACYLTGIVGACLREVRGWWFGIWAVWILGTGWRMHWWCCCYCSRFNSWAEIWKKSAVRLLRILPSALLG